jgi:hypothetical protein
MVGARRDQMNSKPSDAGRVFISQRHVETLIENWRQISTALDVNSEHYNRRLCLLPAKGNFVEVLLCEDDHVVPFVMFVPADVTAPFDLDIFDDFRAPLVWGEAELDRIIENVSRPDFLL